MEAIQPQRRAMTRSQGRNMEAIQPQRRAMTRSQGKIDNIPK